MKRNVIFPRDPDTLGIIRELEEYLGLVDKNIDKISNLELIEYIDQLGLFLLLK